MRFIQMTKRTSSKRLGFKESTERGDDDYLDNNSTSEIGCSASSKCSIDGSNRRDRLVETSHASSFQSWNDVGNSMVQVPRLQQQQTGMTSTSRPAKMADTDMLARNEERCVRFSECVVVGALMLTCAVLAAAVFLLSTTGEENYFHAEFESRADTILSLAKESVGRTLGAFTVFASSISSTAQATGQNWPNVTIPDFASHAFQISNLASLAATSKTMLPAVAFCPVVRQGDQFDDYATGSIYDVMQLNDKGSNLFTYGLPGIDEELLYLNLTNKHDGGTAEGNNNADSKLVLWQSYPAPATTSSGGNRMFLHQSDVIEDAFEAAITTKHSQLVLYSSASDIDIEGLEGHPSGNVRSLLIQPIYNDFSLHPSYQHRDYQLNGDDNVMTRTEGEEDLSIVGILLARIDWINFFQQLIPEVFKHQSGTVYVVIENSCGFVSTILLNQTHATYLGAEDLHERQYGDMEISDSFDSFYHPISPDLDLTGDQTLGGSICSNGFTVRLFPSESLEQIYMTERPLYYTAFVIASFVITCICFFIFDWSVRTRQRAVMKRVNMQDKIVSNLFPGTFRDRLYGLTTKPDGDDDMASGDDIDDNMSVVSFASNTITDLVQGLDYMETMNSTTPLADLFLETTVLFADIAGFTAWSSAREPSQVFILLETIYGHFDKVARKLGVFKIETVGDCYVAVTGLPEPRKDHAVAMAKFARECMDRMRTITNRLEVTLGPDTSDLGIRMGLHSGQVTAGVLRGERSRFQLFGDTVNTAARMESTGLRNCIQVSSITANLLREQGRSKWLREREEKISVHGKGSMQTFWIETKKDAQIREARQMREPPRTEVGIPKVILQEHNVGSECFPADDIEHTSEDGSTGSTESFWETEEQFHRSNMTQKERLVEWNIAILSALLKQVIAARTFKNRPRPVDKVEQDILSGQRERIVLEEFKEIIALPRITLADLEKRGDPHQVSLQENVVHQLRDFMTKVADLYQPNAFHNFEHASHVTASVTKLLSRIIKVDTTNQTKAPKDLELVDLAGHSYGITSDPLTQFAVVFSAIIHDAQHPGVPNTQLVKEGLPIAARYKHQSIAEQNSVDLAWNLLMEPTYKELRGCIYGNVEELKRFRQLVVNIVMATDVVDKELGALRKARWKKAFKDEDNNNNDDRKRDHPDDRDDDATKSSISTVISAAEQMNRKATIVLEHLIQASDVSHTMQHWNVYRRWNQRYFEECYIAYQAGRAEKDPSVGWYEGELGFFDFYVIPLAKKLHNCGVFGVSSREYLNYALANREEWSRKGRDLVKTYLSEVTSKTTNHGVDSELC